MFTFCKIVLILGNRYTTVVVFFFLFSTLKKNIIAIPVHLGTVVSQSSEDLQKVLHPEVIC